VAALRRWAGIDEYLDKPVTARQLLRAVESLIHRSNQDSASEEA